MTQREIRDRLQRRRIGELADQWRAIARGTPPWTVIEREGEALLWDVRENQLLGTLRGQWTPRVAQYLDALSPYAGRALAELLWNIGGHGNPASVQQQAADLLNAMGLPAERPAGRG